jgi:hypothetical protein
MHASTIIALFSVLIFPINIATQYIILISPKAILTDFLVRVFLAYTEFFVFVFCVTFVTFWIFCIFACTIAAFEEVLVSISAVEADFLVGVFFAQAEFLWAVLGGWALVACRVLDVFAFTVQANGEVLVGAVAVVAFFVGPRWPGHEELCVVDESCDFQGEGQPVAVAFGPPALELDFCE